MNRLRSFAAVSWIALFILIAPYFKSSSSTLDRKDVLRTYNVSKMLIDLGDDRPLHYKERLDSIMVQKGKELVTTGRTTNFSGKVVKLQSRHFKCTNCHNLVKEDPDLSVNDPEARLAYAMENNLPYLPGTTLYGTVNRTSWYNDDYYKKYGDLVSPARDTLVNAIQLCARECSKGRAFEPWELDAVLQYLWTLQLKISDLNISDEELELLADNHQSRYEKMDLLKSKYLTKSHATFLDPLPKNQRKFGIEGDAIKGKALLELSCRHCHHPNKEISKYRMRFDKLSTQYLWKNSGKSNNFSLYVVTRKGFYQVGSRETYMPHYTQERLNDQQIEDMIAFLRNIQ